MKPPDCTAKALRQFLDAPPGEPARSAFKAFSEAQATEEKRDRKNRRQMPLPGMRAEGKKQRELF